MSRQKLTKRIVDAAAPTAVRFTIWDTQVAGFGLRVTPLGVKTFLLRYRPKGRSTLKRYLTLGRYGIVTVEEAREHAKRILGAVANGKDPAHEAITKRAVPTLAIAAADFLTDHVALKRKPKTVSSYTHALEHHLIPKFGQRPLSELTRVDVGRFHTSLASTPYMANAAVAVLSSLYGWAERRGLTAEGHNPARRIEKFRESRRERFLTKEEFARLGTALREAESVGVPYEVDETRPTAKHAAKPENRCVIAAPDAVAAIRLLLLTGCRLREILNLRWREVDFERGVLLLADSKTGRKTVVLGAPAVMVLKSLPQVGEYVFDHNNPRVLALLLIDFASARFARERGGRPEKWDSIKLSLLLNWYFRKMKDEKEKREKEKSKSRGNISDMHIFTQLVEDVRVFQKESPRTLRRRFADAVNPEKNLLLKHVLASWQTKGFALRRKRRSLPDWETLPDRWDEQFTPALPVKN